MSAKFVERAATPGTVWSRYPTLYEINTWIWLSELSRKYGKRKFNLSSVPLSEWDALAAYSFQSVWLMGVWERSPAGISITRRTLPDFCPEDNAGSPYCVRRYVVDQHRGGVEGLAVAHGQKSAADPFWLTCDRVRPTSVMEMKCFRQDFMSN